MGSRRVFWLLAVVLTTFPWFAMADDSSLVTASYKLKNTNARQVAKSLAELLNNQPDIKVSVPIGASENELLVRAAKDDQATIGAFLAIVDRRSQLLFPEEVERAMMGDKVPGKINVEPLRPKRGGMR